MVHAGADRDLLDPAAVRLPRLVVLVSEVRHRLGRVGGGIGDGEGVVGGVVRPVQAGAEVAPRQLLYGELFPDVLPLVSLPRASGHMQLDIPRIEIIKDIRLDDGDGGRVCPSYGHVLQRYAVGKGQLSDRVHTLRDREAGELLAPIKGVLSDRAELRVSGQRDACQLPAISKGAISDRGYALRDRDVRQRKAVPKDVYLDRLEPLGQRDAGQRRAPP